MKPAGRGGSRTTTRGSAASGRNCCGCFEQVGLVTRRYGSVRTLLLAVLVTASLIVAPRAGASSVPGAANCPTFPNNSVWHADVSHAPVHPQSARFVSSIGTSAHAHADFGSG